MAPTLTTLPNGIRVACDPMPGTGWAALDVFVACSPLEETPRHAGAAHAIEHMVLGRGEGDPLTRLRALDRVGSLNAATGSDHTVYEADLLPERLDDVLALLGAALGRPWWEEWGIERDVLAEETALARDDPADRAEVLARRAVFGPGHPYGRPIEGTDTSLEATTASVLERLHSRTYVGRRMVVAAAGDIDPSAVADAVERHLGGVPAGAPRGPAPPAPTPAPARGGRDDGDRTHVVVAAPAPGAGDPRWPALTHLDALLAGMWSGRLTVELRERRGLTYDVWSGASAHWGAGSVMAGLAVAPSRIAEAVAIIGRELRALRDGRIAAADAETARAWCVDQARLAFRSPAARAGRLGRRLITGRDPAPAEEDIDALRAVTPADIARAAAETWHPDRIAVVTVGRPPAGVVGRLPELVSGAGAAPPGRAARPPTGP